MMERTSSMTAEEEEQCHLRPEQGRKYLGWETAELRHGAQKRRVMQTIAEVFPCQALLHRWGRASSPKWLLCSGDTETVAHLQCWCPGLMQARIAAHHAIATRIILISNAPHTSYRQVEFHPELTASSLRAIDVPLDQHRAWNRMVDDELDEMKTDDDLADVENLQALARLRPDAWVISWSKRQVLLLELTRGLSK